MCGWIGNGILARAPIRPNSAEKAFDLATWHRCPVRPDRRSGVVRIRPRDGGGLRSSRADTRTPVSPWPHASTMIQWSLQRELGFDLIGLPAPMRIVTNAYK